jgi:hypothetical protein
LKASALAYLNHAPVLEFDHDVPPAADFRAGGFVLGVMPMALRATASAIVRRRAEQVTTFGLCSPWSARRANSRHAVSASSIH